MCERKCLFVVRSGGISAPTQRVYDGSVSRKKKTASLFGRALQNRPRRYRLSRRIVIVHADDHATATRAHRGRRFSRRVSRDSVRTFRRTTPALGHVKNPFRPSSDETSSSSSSSPLSSRNRGLGLLFVLCRYKPLICSAYRTESVLLLVRSSAR